MRTPRAVAPVALLLLAVSCRDAVTAPAAFERSTLDVAAATSAMRDRDRDRHATTFERFTLGAIDGQFDWKSLGGLNAPPPSDPTATHCAVYDHEIADVASVLGPHARHEGFGRRSLRISNAVTSGCYADATFSARTRDVAGESGATSKSKSGLVDYARAGATRRRHFEAEWRILSAVPGAVQPGLEMQVSPARGDDHRMSWVQIADRADGLEVTFAERSNPAAAGAFVMSTVATRLDRRESHTIGLTIDFVDGPSNDVVRVFVDGRLRHTGTSWENYYRYDANGVANFGGATPAVNRLMFRTGNDIHRGLPGTPAPATRGHGFLLDRVRVTVW